MQTHTRYFVFLVEKIQICQISKVFCGFLETQKMTDDLEDRSPGSAYEIFVDNERLIENLKLLDFETKFVAKGLRPISRVTFAIQNK